MKELGARIGGEPSGHILIDGGMPTSCGVFTAAKLLTLDPKKWMNSLEGFSKTHQSIAKIKIQDISHLDKKIAELSASGLRVVIRESGTEPVIRIMVEGEESISISALDELLGMIEK